MTDQATSLKIDTPVLYLALFFIIALGIRSMAYLVNILLVSVILTLMAIPVMEWLRKKGLSDFISALLIALTACLCILTLVVIIFYSYQILAQGLPLYQEELNMRLAEITAFFGNNNPFTVGISSTGFDLTTILQTVLSSVFGMGEALMYLFFIGVATFFLLLEVPHLPGRIKRVFGNNPEKLSEISRMSRYIIDFLIVRTETNLVHGVLFGGALWVMGVHAAIVWGLLTFLLGYIPYIGLIVAAIPAIFFAYLQFGVWGAVAVIGIVCILNIVVENPVFSYLASRRFEIPALIVLFSVIFWGWLLGIFGMLFSVPMTLMVLILFQCSDDLRKVNILIGVSRLFESDPDR
jgi:AI-2 transport protein TqsA